MSYVCKLQVELQSFEFSWNLHFGGIGMFFLSVEMGWLASQKKIGFLLLKMRLPGLSTCPCLRPSPPCVPYWTPPHLFCPFLSLGLRPPSSASLFLQHTLS